ncbi:GFA family protein, partial [Streptococcus suis]
AVALTARVGDLAILSGADRLSTYRFNTGAAEHHFCSVCGIYTHHRRRSNGDEYGVNAACLDGVSPFDFPEIPVNDGVHHPSDGGSNRIVGVLRFVPAA